MRTTYAFLTVLVLAGCKGQQADAGPTTSASAAPPEPPVQFIGRCVNETSGVPYQSVFLFPKKNEMFFYLGTDGAVRVPMSVTNEEPRKLDFTFRWSEKNEPPMTRTGHLTPSGTKWDLGLEVVKGCTCKPGPAPDFYKLLPELGIQAGKWADAQHGLTVVIAADAQIWVVTETGKTTNVSYRILDNTPSGVIVASWGRTPGDADDEGWAVSRLTRVGDELVHELRDEKARYKLIAAAPALK
jgi:hypothetical protein